MFLQGQHEQNTPLSGEELAIEIRRFALRRKTRVTHLESLNLDSAFFRGWAQAYSKLTTGSNQCEGEVACTTVATPTPAVAIVKDLLDRTSKEGKTGPLANPNVVL